MLEFLRAREGPGGESVLSLLGPPLRQEDGWYSLQWRQFDRARQREDGRARWVRAWHGCKLEALYSILYHGRLRASCDKSMGDRYFDGAPGIYVHKDATSRKAENYVRFVHLCGDGVFWAAKWEVVVDRRQSVAAPHQTSGSRERGRRAPRRAVGLRPRGRGDAPRGRRVAGVARRAGGEPEGPLLGLTRRPSRHRLRGGQLAGGPTANGGSVLCALAACRCDAARP
ncbi:unnamed protein product [Prorocentrum cordatum]|uniref:PARP n=1 Tax=Prorocentrum cordatum TaxID=2364126 RepID=A0ABN9VCR1_9DINO|nr:unnamed protein product [Polarella glacialis]